MMGAGLGAAAVGALPGPAGGAAADAPAAARVAVLAYEGQWPRVLCAYLRRAYGLALEVTVVATPDEARERVRRASLRGPAGDGGRASAVDVVTVGLEEVAAWRAEGLLAPLPLSPPAAVAEAVVAHGGAERGGPLWLAPMTLGFDVAFGLGAPGAALLGRPAPEAAVPSWSVLGDPAVQGGLTLEPDAAVWIALRLVDPDGSRLARAEGDADAARSLFRAVDETLAAWRREVAALWTDTATFLTAVARDGVVAGAAWDVLIRRLARHPRAERPNMDSHGDFEFGRSALNPTDRAESRSKSAPPRWFRFRAIGASAPAAVARVPREGAPAWMDGLAMPQGAPHPVAARRLIAVMAAPPMQAAWASAADAIPADRAAWSLMAASERAWAERVLVADGGLGRLMFRPALHGPAAQRFADSRDRFEYP
ncbi:hypothetical protein [Roseospira goensis]|uniref:Spermidine/putrescine-binding protein n=1 Tax=Roseospira goensis TaxID=391922 RepID=A0A7W6RYC4_9PROT|nr:hypothetical protein [Roseospira goensis]MBB4284844.1 spermidine/putrescine-binding protein [Roseospira goensis]